MENSITYKWGLSTRRNPSDGKTWGGVIVEGQRVQKPHREHGMVIPSRHIHCGHDQPDQSGGLCWAQIVSTFDITYQCPHDMWLAWSQRLPDIRQQPHSPCDLSNIPPVSSTIPIIPNYSFKLSLSLPAKDGRALGENLRLGPVGVLVKTKLRGVRFHFPFVME